MKLLLDLPALILALAIQIGVYNFSGQAKAASLPHDTPERHGISGQSLEEFTKIVSGLVANDQIVGAEVVMVKDSCVVYHETFGWKDREDSRPMQKNSYFNIRSMTKPITGAAIQILIDEGKLKLTDKAADYLPGFRNDKSKDITIEQLLTHHSGLPLTILTGFADYNDIQTMADSIGHSGPTRIPGAEFWYSDAGVDALAAIVERVSGEKLEAFVQDHLLGPLGMNNTVYFTKRTEHKPISIVSLYYQANGKWTKYWKEGNEPLYSCPWGSQSIYSTPLDYAKFLSMWIRNGTVGNHVILSPEAIKRTLTPVSPMKSLGVDMQYLTGFPHHKVYHGQLAMLFVDTTTSQTTAVGYGGSDGTFAWAWPDKDLIVLYFTQSRGQATGLRLESEIYRLFVDTTQGTSDQIIEEEMAPFLGIYSFDASALQGPKFRIVVQNNCLALDIPGQMIFELNPPNESGWRCFKVLDLSSVRFEADSTGDITRMLFRQDTPFPLKPGSTDSAGMDENLGRYLGEFLLPMDQGTIRTVIENNRLKITTPQGGMIELAKTEGEEGWSIDSDPNRQLVFQFDVSGKLTGMMLKEISPMYPCD